MRTPETGSVYTRKVNGRRLPKYYIWWVDENGKRHDRVSCTDKKAAEEDLRKTLREVGLRQQGLVSASVGELTRPIRDHLADFLDCLRASRPTQKYVNMVETRLKRVFDGIGATRWRDLDPHTIKLFLNQPAQSRVVAERTLIF
jgi:hypothetical protein